ncbi:histidine--tRNA ligase, partial [Ureaplasma urealyticum]
MSNYTKPRGTVDLYNEAMNEFKSLENFLLTTTKKYGFQQIKTPIFEFAELFMKSAGESSDLVSKEMYLFKDKSDRWLALRPEGTAGVIRAVVENKLLLNNPLPLKLMYFEPCFRYERPQAGRQRQFHQFGVEVLGTKNIYYDFELIALANNILKKLAISDYVLEINYISTAHNRSLWVKSLQEYFNLYRDELTPLSQERITTNPLRILDDKLESQKLVVQQAPKITNFLSNEEKEEFALIKKMLDEHDIKYRVNEGLVRGLDYYSGLVFEFISTSPRLLGQSTIIGGGRYGQLIKQTGGPDYEGIGFGIGIERLLIALLDSNKQILNNFEDKYLIAYFDKELENEAIKLTQSLRINNQLNVDIILDTIKADKIFRLAQRLNAKKLIILAKKEWLNKQVILKDLLSFEQ